MEAVQSPWSILKKQVSEKAIFMYMTSRAAVFTIEFETLDRLLGLLPQSQRVVRKGDREIKRRLLQEILSLFKKDAALFAENILPLENLRPESLKTHRHRLFKLLWDGRKLYRRRKNRENKKFSDLSAPEFQFIPEYYLRNYHFQTDGYLSEESAELYDHQVDMLFSGTTDAMRRSWIKPLLNLGVNLGVIENSPPPRILDVACGTGSSTAILHSLFPESALTAIDISHPYIQHGLKRFSAHKNPPHFLNRDFRHSKLPNSHFDLVSCMFLFHELPRVERLNVLKEINRVTKTGGHVIIVDAIQKNPEETWLEPMIKDFPINYHEPFFIDYASYPMEDLAKNAGFHLLTTDRAFMSRFWILQKSN